MHRRKKSAVWLALLAYIGIGLGGSETIVLCIEGGRMAIEVGGCDAHDAKTPWPIKSSSPKRSEGDKPVKVHSEPCVDIPLITAGLNDPLMLADRFPSPSPSSLVSIRSLVVSSLIPRVTDSLLPYSTARAAPSLRHLRAVVLLI
ncbi:MAG: hypothetical protein HYT87_18120 [Nitrospirae bacterium]|nr:hypothetical protein [Nitrospirota bacterium]